MTAKPTLADLEAASPFEARHLGPGADEQAKMLAALGYGSLDELTDAALPDVIRSLEALSLPDASSETEALGELPGRDDSN